MRTPTIGQTVRKKTKIKKQAKQNKTKTVEWDSFIGQNNNLRLRLRDIFLSFTL